MRQIRPEYEFPIEGRAWTQGSQPTAGVFFLDGDCHIVARHGPAALELVERGALLIAQVRFDGVSADGASAGHAVRALHLREAVARFAPPAPDAERRPTGRFRSGLPLDGGGHRADP